MNDKKLTHNDFLQRLDIRDVLLDAGYRQNRRFGLRLSSFIRTDSEEKRIRGDKFVITQQGKMLLPTTPAEGIQRVSFIKEHPALFAEYYEGIDLNRLVNLVCSRLLNIPFEEYEVQTVPVKQDLRPFDITDYDLHRFNPQDHEMQEIFYPYFKNRGIDLSTQNAFHRHMRPWSRMRCARAGFCEMKPPLRCRGLEAFVGDLAGAQERRDMAEHIAAVGMEQQI